MNQLTEPIMNNENQIGDNIKVSNESKIIMIKNFMKENIGVILNITSIILASYAIYQLNTDIPTLKDQTNSLTNQLNVNTMLTFNVSNEVSKLIGSINMISNFISDISMINSNLMTINQQIYAFNNTVYEAQKTITDMQIIVKSNEMTVLNDQRYVNNITNATGYLYGSIDGLIKINNQIPFIQNDLATMINSINTYNRTINKIINEIDEINNLINKTKCFNCSTIVSGTSYIVEDGAFIFANRTWPNCGPLIINATCSVDYNSIGSASLNLLFDEYPYPIFIVNSQSSIQNIILTINNPICWNNLSLQYVTSSTSLTIYYMMIIIEIL
jgi:prefoldin subunit 5